MTDEPIRTGSPTIAIVGSGPAGCYLAQFLNKQWSDAQIIIFDRLALPYGLVRYGVAPDHLGTKAVTKQFDRLLDKPGITFIGNTHIGGDLTVAELRDSFDIVVLATGLDADRLLDNHRPELAGVIGSGALTRLINGHPNENPDQLTLGPTVTIVGHGNVAIDVVRLLLTRPTQLIALGVSEDVAAAIGHIPITRINIVGRSPAAAAKFDPSMLKELGTLPNTRITANIYPGSRTEQVDDPRISAINELVEASPFEAPRTITFYFGWTPVSLDGDTAVDGVTFQRPDGKLQTLATDSVVTAIGFLERDEAATQLHHHSTTDTDLTLGYLQSGLYCVGWVRRGATGTIPANRVDARMVADQIIHAVTSTQLPITKPGFTNLPTRTSNHEKAHP